MEETFAPSWTGSVVLDIGGNIGALVLYVPRELEGSEIELRPDDRHQPLTHSAVRERRGEGDSTYAAVYPRLPAGDYTIVGSTQRITITPGRVVEVQYSL